MGKGRVIESLGDGLYRLQITRDRDRVQARIDQLTEYIATWRDDKIPAAEAKEAEKLNELRAQETTLSNQQAATQLQILQLESARAALALEYAAARAASNILKGEVVAMRTERERLRRETADPDPVDAWCTDLTTDLATDTDIGTIEVPGERNGVPVLIQPGYDSTANFSKLRDGKLMPVAALSPEAYFWNHCMMPGWQKWRPNYRIGTITALENDLADVLLDAALSSQQQIDVNAKALYTGVGFRYMTCNAAAFSVDDRVVLEFSDVEGDILRQPTVIGFESNPKPCSSDFCGIPVDNLNLLGYGEPVPEPTDEVPDPVSPHPAPQTYKISASGASWEISDPSRKQYGNIDWRGTAGILTWWGAHGRYWYSNAVNGWYLSSNPPNTTPPGNVYYAERRTLYTDEVKSNIQPFIYRNGEVLATAPLGVLGAALATYNDIEYLIAICAETNVSAFNDYGAIRHVAYYLSGEDWIQLDEITIDYEIAYADYYGSCLNPFFFSASGTKAVSVYLMYNQVDFYAETWESDFAVTFSTETVVVDEVETSVDTLTGAFSRSKVSTGTSTTTATSSGTNSRTFDQQLIIDNGSDPPYVDDVTQITGYESVASSGSFSSDFEDVLAADYVGEVKVKLKVSRATSGSGSITGATESDTHSFNLADGLGGPMASWVYSDTLGHSCDGSVVVTDRIKLWIDGHPDGDAVIYDETATRTKTVSYNSVQDPKQLTYIGAAAAAAIGLPERNPTYGDWVTRWTTTDVTENAWAFPYVYWADLRVNSAMLRFSTFENSSQVVNNTDYTEVGGYGSPSVFGQILGTELSWLASERYRLHPGYFGSNEDGDATIIYINGDAAFIDVHNGPDTPIFTQSQAWNYDQTIRRSEGFGAGDILYLLNIPGFVGSAGNFASSNQAGFDSVTIANESGGVSDNLELQDIVLLNRMAGTHLTAASNFENKELMLSYLVIPPPYTAHYTKVVYFINGTYLNNPSDAFQLDESQKPWYSILTPVEPQ